MLPNILAGLLGGLIVAIGGAVKDSPHEGFQPLTFVRSIWVAGIGGVLSTLVTKDFLPALCVAVCFERLSVEGYKIVRGKTPGKFLWAGSRYQQAAELYRQRRGIA